MSKVNTVTGQIDTTQLGRTLVHEHLLFGFPGWCSDTTIGALDFDWAVRYLSDEVRKGKANGVNSIVDATPNECDRNPLLMKAVAEEAEVNVICATGYYFEDVSTAAYWHRHEKFGIDIVEELYEMFVKEIEQAAFLNCRRLEHVAGLSGAHTRRVEQWGRNRQNFSLNKV